MKAQSNSSRYEARVSAVRVWQFRRDMKKQNDPEAAKRFLMKAGILDEEGHLAEGYRAEHA